MIVWLKPVGDAGTGARGTALMPAGREGFCSSQPIRRPSEQRDTPLLRVSPPPPHDARQTPD